MTRLYEGSDRLRVDTPAAGTEVLHNTPMPQKMLQMAQAVALHLHLPPLTLPRMRLILPILAILLSGVGLILGLRSPHAHHQGMIGTASEGGRP